MKSKRAVSPALVLLLLSPMVGELLSGSAPPAEFFSPFSLLILVALYGGGAILARELVQRWGKGWPSLLILGAAYGILEEGLMVKSFFDPQWVDLGRLGSYGRWVGVNWVWSLELTIYHAVFSIAIPILLVTLMFPDRRNQPWIGRRTFRLLTLLLASDVVFGALVLTPYRPAFGRYALAALLAASLVLVARRLPAGQPRTDLSSLRAPRPRWAWALGLGATLGFFALSWALPNTDIPPAVTMLLIAGLAAGVGSLVTRWIRKRAGWSDRHALALATGGLSFFILLAPLQELDRARPDNTAGMTFVGLAAAALLVWLARRLWRSQVAQRDLAEGASP
jgi:peptidoglycan/LPS O-acetylase OafA/YrhL